jgi:CheY-like chemotaxis protein
MIDGQTLLVVDDEEGNRTLLKTFFTKKGFNVRVAVDGHEGLANCNADVDVVLLDMMMPGLGGLEVLRRLRQGGNAVPVLVLTAVASPELVVEAMQAGAQDYVTKPFSLPVLLQRIERVLQQARDAVGTAEVIDEADGIVMLAPLPPPPAPGEDRTDHVAVPPLPTPSTLPRTTSSASLIGPASLLSRLRQMTRRLLPDQPVLEAGALLSGRYRLGEPLGAGAFGAVWRARHVDLDLDVAIKVLHKDAKPVRPNETALESFRREAMLTARINSPHAVRVSDFGVTAEGHAYLVMELLKGQSLRQKLTSSGPLPLHEACGAVADVCDALATAHRHGVVHRDVKALNVFVATLDDESPRTTIKLIDFGAAGSIDEERTGAVLVGTPTHMAPERFVDPRGTPASDVYAAGIMLFQLLTGAVPFQADDVAALARLHQSAPIPLPSSRRAHVDVADDIVTATLAKEPSARPSAKVLAMWLRKVARGEA